MLPALNIIVYGNNTFADINNLIENQPIIKPYTKYPDTKYFKEEDLNWTFYLIQSEYDKKTSDLIKTILEDHYAQKIYINFFNEKDDQKKKKESKYY